MKKKVLISTGGSGGHVMPAIAFYDHLKENFDIVLVTDLRGATFINKKKYKFEIIKSPRLSFSFFTFPLTLIKFFVSIFSSFFFLKKNKINFIIGTGGYMSVPICIAAKILNIKINLFEPNMVIGRANKFLLKFSENFFCYSNEIINFPMKHAGKIRVIDHILRKEIYDENLIKENETSSIITILILGGSQGAKFFDKNLKNSIVNLSKKYKIKVFHQSSSSNFKDLELFYKENQIINHLFNFEENIFKYIRQSNLAITRAGASTLTELTFFSVPFIAIPYKFATDNHQQENANYYLKKDCCWMLKEEDCDESKLTALLLSIIQNKEDFLKKKKGLKKISYQNNFNNVNEKLIGFFI